MIVMDQRTQAGVEIEPAPHRLDGATLARQRDLHMLALSLSGLSYRQIANYFSVSKSHVANRIKAIPPTRRERFARRLSRSGFPAAPEAR